MVVAGVEVDVAADGRHADAVAVVADAADDAAHQERRPRVVEAAEAQRVEDRDRARAHREDVAQDAADARRRALERLDERRMVVALDLEDRGEPVADVDRAGVLARPLQHLRARASAAGAGSARELLYEQCSDHITPKTPSSSNVGVRPRSSTILRVLVRA